MCGRFAVTTDPARLAVQLDAVNETGPNSWGPNYNVAPTTNIAAVVARHDDPEDPDDRRAGAERPGIGTEATRRIRLMRWGLLPSWVKADADGRPVVKAQLINARAEKVTTSPAFRSAAAHKRCLIPMDGYYEWMPADDPKGRKTPFYLHRADDRPLLVAGLWSVWRPRVTRGSDQADQAQMLTCTIITTDAVDQLGRIHDRMPLAVAEADWDRWLDPDLPAPADLLATPPDITGIAVREVSTLVNNVRNNGPELIAPAEPGNQPVGLF
jgi:putative SOS response-associated peptidase YedK